MEKEEERYINELIREEAIAQKEIEKYVKTKEQEEFECLKEIGKLTKKIEAEKDGATTKLEALVSELNQKIYILQQEKQRAMSMAQLTRSGHIYIISNRGSFGPDVYKIGMTRRLDPMDRVRELGDASVPFYFDVHGIIHTEDAPSLERELHKAFDDRRVNKHNYRREFFKAKIEDIEEVISRVHGHITLDRNPQ
jgi:vacuolar-type H+-ATPase subunit I/STV1